MSRRILIMAGGTGGHVFPGLAVAEALRSHGETVAWLGTAAGIEARLVPAAGIELHTLPVTGLRGKGLATLALAPLRLGIALWSALGLMLRLKPRAVLGCGGFASGPGGVIAAALGYPLAIHEQNAIPGMTNRWLARVADRVFEGFPSSFPAGVRAEWTGNPVREAITNLPSPSTRMHGRGGRPRLLVVGGSLGAQAFNELLPQALARLPEPLRPEVRHQCGERHADAARQAYAQAGVAARVEPFIADMAEAYGWADCALCRAGALTVSELAAAGLGALLVPYPFAVDDHQTANAGFLAARGAAVVCRQHDLDPATLAKLLGELLGDRPRLLAMAESARACAKPQAAERVAAALLALAGGAA